jgi:hypothetical protein
MITHWDRLSHKTSAAAVASFFHLLQQVRVIYMIALRDWLSQNSNAGCCAGYLHDHALGRAESQNFSRCCRIVFPFASVFAKASFASYLIK